MNLRHSSPLTRAASRLVCASALFLGASCGDDDGATPGPGPDDAAMPADASTPGAIVIEGRLARYEVPVTQSALEPFAAYQVTDAEWRITSRGERRLQYTLPADLAGTAQVVELEGTDSGSPWQLVGEVPGTTGDCVTDGPYIVCTEHLPGIVVDLPALEARVAAGTLTPEQLEVSRVFAPDPIGILRFAPP